jgi:glyceraldehyde 3-phosphate dehydrogenase
MTIKVAINGYGRIGRNTLRAHYEGGKKHDLAIVAVNDLGSPETNAHLTRYDTAHGKVPWQGRGRRRRDGRRRRSYQGARAAQSAELPWQRSAWTSFSNARGLFTTKGKGRQAPRRRREEGDHLRAGGKDVDATIVYGVNQARSRRRTR